MVSSNDSLTDAAGTAIVSISTVTPAIHVMVVFTGLLTVKRRHDNQVVLKLFAEDKQTAVLEKVIFLRSISTFLFLSLSLGIHH